VSGSSRGPESAGVFSASDVGGVVQTSTCEGSGVIGNASGPNAWPAAPYDPAFPWHGIATVLLSAAVGAVLGLGVVYARRRLSQA
jgi:hypothetical protein